MTHIRYLPSGLAKVSAREEGGRWTLVFTRELRHPPERVWAALTDPAELSAWAPFDADRALGAAGEATLTMAGEGGGEPSRSTIRIADRPRLLEYTWDEDVLRWEREPTDTGTRLVLYHTLQDRAWITRVSAGWHICLDVAARMMDGAPVGRIVGEDGKKHGWAELDAAYAEQLGVPASE